MQNLEQKLMGLAQVPVGKKLLVTAALPYINNVPHLGHIVGSHLPADIFARYCRLKGHETFFVGGTDENGSTSEIAAAELGLDINRFCDVLHAEHKKIYDFFGISYDAFSRTTSPIHHQTTQEVFAQIKDNGFISKSTMKVLYSPNEERFLPDRYVRGTCPHCNYERASGDQCEKCTTVLDATELINPISTTTGDKLVVREAQHLFLKLDKLAPQLKDWINEQDQWRSQVSSIAMGWINEGLRERCITRDLKHGVKVPLEGYENKVFYVWFDAPIGYMSFTREARPDWEDFWKSDNGRIYNFLGKDNIPFHTIFWPGMIMATGGYRLPDNVVGLQYLNYEGGKFSKSQRRGVFCENLFTAGIPRDALRAALVPLIPETADTEFKWAEFQQSINAHLVGNFGNFVNRTVSFTKNKLSGEVKRPSQDYEVDTGLRIILAEKTESIGKFIEGGEIRKAYNEFLTLSSAGNKYFEDSKPWAVVKDNPQRAEEILYNCVSLCRSLAILSAPFLPDTPQRIWYQLGLEGKADAPGNWDSARKLRLPTDRHAVRNPDILYQRLTEDALEDFKRKVTTPTDLKQYFN